MFMTQHDSNSSGIHAPEGYGVERFVDAAKKPKHILTIITK